MNDCVCLILKVTRSDYGNEQEDEEGNELYGDNQWNSAPVPYRQEGISDDEGKYQVWFTP